MNAKTIVGHLWCGLLLLAGTAWAADPIGSIVSLQGEATAVGADGQERKLDMKAPVYMNDKLTTRGGARLQVMFSDDSVMALGESSELVINEYVYAPKTKADNACVMSVLKGVMRVITGKVTDLNPDRFKVKTRMATIGIRGCELGFRVSERGEDIMIIELPEHLNVTVERTEGLEAGVAPRRAMNVPRQGVLVSLAPGRPMDQRPLRAEEIRALRDESSPALPRGPGPAPGAGEGRQGQGQGGGGALAGDQGAGGGTAGGGATDGGLAGGGSWGDFAQAGGGTLGGGTLGADAGGAYTPGAGTPGTQTDPNSGSTLNNVINQPTYDNSTQPSSGTDSSSGSGSTTGSGTGSGSGTSGGTSGGTGGGTSGGTSDGGTGGGTGGGTSGGTGDGGVTPEQPKVIAGRALGAEFATGAGYYSLTTLYAYDQITGEADASGQFEGTAYGAAYNRDGGYIESVSEALGPWAIAPFGSPTTYEAMTEVSLGAAAAATAPTADGQPKATGALLAYDNLAQFFRYSDAADAGLALAYGGYYAGYYGATLPTDTVLKYDVRGLHYEKDYFFGASPALDDGTLYVNTRTGAYRWQTSAGANEWGYTDELEFFGQSLQGVGHVDAGAREPNAFAGFRDINFSASPDSGNWTYAGYGVALRQSSLSPYTDPSTFGARLYRSANEGSDDPGANEGRFWIALDQGAYRNNVSLSGNVFADPAAATPDLTLTTPDRSFYVNDDQFAAQWETLNSFTEIKNRDSSEDWTWGEWEQENWTTDGAGGTILQNVMNGVFVVGDTLSAAEFAALANGAAGYTLTTPAGRGIAAAVLSYGNGYSGGLLEGSSALTVQIPGGGGQPTWSGAFALSQTLGARTDALTFDAAGNITGNGHLQGTVGTYSLTVDGVTYDANALAAQGLTGSLVGPGSGARPVTGAIGQFSFDHGASGPQVNGVYASDL